MPYHRAEHLNHQDVRIDELVVHSYEMGVYLVEADYDGRREKCRFGSESNTSPRLEVRTGGKMLNVEF